MALAAIISIIFFAALGCHLTVGRPSWAGVVAGVCAFVLALLTLIGTSVFAV